MRGVLALLPAFRPYRPQVALGLLAVLAAAWLGLATPWLVGSAVDRLSPDFPIRLTTGRRLDSFNTGVQSAGYTSPLRRGESLDLAPEDIAAMGLTEGERVRVVSRRGAVEVAVRSDETLRPGLADPRRPGSSLG